MSKYVFFFGGGKADGNAKMKNESSKIKISNHGFYRLALKGYMTKSEKTVTYAVLFNN